MKKIFAVFTLFFGLSLTANAGILVEPYIGYQTGDVKIDPIVGSDYTYKNTGVGYGLRLGYKILAPWVALDYTGSSGTSKRDANPDVDYTATSLAGVVGVDLPLIRAWAGYGFSNETTLKGTAGSADTKFKGTYVKAGVGLGFIPFVSVNAEYQMNSFTKVDLGAGEVERSAVYDSLKNDMLMLSVSIPFNL